MAGKTETRVRTYERDVPKHYVDHGDRVRGWVPPNSPYAEKNMRKKH